MSAGSDYASSMPDAAPLAFPAESVNIPGNNQAAADGGRHDHGTGSRAFASPQRARVALGLLHDAGPGARVAALLDRSGRSPTRSWSRSTTGPTVCAADLAVVADRIVLYPYREPVDRPLPWLFAQCRGDWVLALDDDEIPSLALIEALPGSAPPKTSPTTRCPAGGSSPTRSAYLDEAPWRPDYQLRLFRRMRAHSLLGRVPPADRRDRPGPLPRVPLWHADTVLRARSERLEKARRYERPDQGCASARGPSNFAFYLPERAASRAPRCSARWRRAMIDAVLAAARRSGPSARR